MRLWSIYPSYLDTKGLVACWRESLLAQEVLKGNTKGYKNHSQLLRFKQSNNPLGFIGAYLVQIAKEGFLRGYKFKEEKIFRPLIEQQLTVTKGQLEYEFLHLQRKLWYRDKQQRIKNESIEWEREGDLLIHNIKPNPIFKVIDGQIESWEKIK